MSGKKKVDTKKFHVGKGIPKNDRRQTPMQGAPNSNLDTYNKKDGTFSGRRKFGKDGKAKKDYDVSDNHKKYDHVHDIKGKKRDSVDRRPTKKEQREIDKAKKKRRFWK